MRSLVEVLAPTTQAVNRFGFRHGCSLVCLLLAFSCGTSTGQTATSKTADSRVHLQRGEDALKAKDVETAAREFRAALAADPRSVEANLNLGVIAFTRGDFSGASGYLRKVVAARPSLVQAQALLAICERRLGDPDAKSRLESAFAKLTETRLRTQVGMELVGLFHEQGDSEHAIPVVQKLVDMNPDDVDILYVAQRLYGELADETLNKLVVVAPGSARMQQVIAERLVNEGELRGAIEHYRKALELDPRLPGVHYELGQAIFEASSSDPAAQSEAEKELQTALILDGDSTRVQCALGKIALARSDLEKAHAHYAQAFSFDQTDTEAQLGLARVLMTMDKPEEARKYLELAVKSDPLNGTAHYRLALAYKRLQMPDDAQREMHLFDEIKKTKDQAKNLYRQMNVQPKGSADDAPDHEQ